MLQLNNFNWYEDFCIEIVYIGIYYSLFCWTGNWMKNIKRRSVLKTGNLGTWGAWQREICYIPQAKWDEPAKNSQNTFSTDSYKVFAWWKINAIYIYIFCTMFLAQQFVEDLFFIPCYMTCFNFCKLLKAKDKYKNFAISKMGICVTMTMF